MEDFKNILRTCPYSGEEFYPKRHNQRFAHRSYREAFHNNVNNEIRRARSKIDKMLHKTNSVFIQEMKNKDQESFHKEYLIGRGCSFDVMTNYVEYQGVKRQAIYDFLIIPDGSRVHLIRHEND